MVVAKQIHRPNHTDRRGTATMKKTARTKRLQEAGFKTTTVKEFLDLSDEDMEFIEMKVALARLLKTHRTATLKVSQTRFAEMIGSSQSRVAKMEAGDPTVSFDLLVRSLLFTGATRKLVARAIA
jgi:hypothetical protein